MFAATQASLLSLGIEAEHVPLGFAQSISDLLPDDSAIARTTEGKGGASELGLMAVGPQPQIDVLFYGTGTPRRLAILADLRVTFARAATAGPLPTPLRVVHANAANYGTFGSDLDLLVMDSKIVLNLLTCKFPSFNIRSSKKRFWSA